MDDVLVGYQAMDKHSGIWFFIRELPIALSYHEMGYKVRTCIARPFNPDGARDVISNGNRQYNTKSLCELPDEGTIPSYREFGPIDGSGD
jgi:hypothetical protein